MKVWNAFVAGGSNRSHQTFHAPSNSLLKVSLLCLYSTAPCKSADHDTCCVDSTCSVSSESCSCDYNCFFNGDCCRDFLLVESCFGEHASVCVCE